MADVPTPATETDGAPTRPSAYDTAGVSPGGQIYTNTEIGKLFYEGGVSV